MNQGRLKLTKLDEQGKEMIILRIMRQPGIKTPDGIKIDVPLSRQNITDYTGTTLFTVSHSISRWEKQGWVKSGRESVILKNYFYIELI